MPRVIPATVRAKAELAGATDWLTGLPALLERLSVRWKLTLGQMYEDGTEAYVTEVALADGTPAVLKLMIPRAGDHAAHEIAVLRLCDGAGCVRLIDAAPADGAMLLERLGPSMADLALPYAERLEILTGLAAAVWRPAPAAAPALPTGADKARWLADLVRRESARLPGAVRRHALACAASREAAHDPARAVLNHGDVHQWNALRTPDGGFRLVDPDGLWAEPEYDLGVLMREDPVELMAGDPWDRARHLAGRTGTDARAIWEWGVVERVTTGLIATSIGLEPVGSQMLAAAERLAEN